MRMHFTVPKLIGQSYTPNNTEEDDYYRQFQKGIHDCPRCRHRQVRENKQTMLKKQQTDIYRKRQQIERMANYQFSDTIYT